MARRHLDYVTPTADGPLRAKLDEHDDALDALELAVVALDLTTFAKLTGRAGGQNLIGGTASGEHLTLNSTAHATKGQVRIGSSTGLVFDETTGHVGLGVAPDATIKYKQSYSTGNIIAWMLEQTSITNSVTARWRGGGGRDLDLRMCGSSFAGNTTYGVAQASLAEFGLTNVTNVGFAGGAGMNFFLAYSTLVKYNFAASLLTLGDGVNLAFNATTGSMLGTAASQKLSVFGVAPAVQGTAVADAAGGATVDAEARTALNALLARIRTFGIIAV